MRWSNERRRRLPAALIICACLVSGAFFALVGAVGLVRLPSFYQRVHAPTLGSSMGPEPVIAP